MGEDLRETSLRFELGGVAVRVLPDAGAACRLVAREIVARLASRRAQGRRMVLGVATGRSPLGVYAELARLRRVEQRSFEDLTVFALDEYLGLAPGHPASFHTFVRRRVQQPLGLDPAEVHVLPSAVDPSAAHAVCEAYEGAIRAAGGVDLQLLGIGGNGHLAFNEPGSARSSRTRVVALASETRAANSPDFPPDETVPTHALTQGIATLLAGHSLRVLAFGAHKADIVARSLTQPIGPELPATFLREHDDVELLLDPTAAAGLPSPR
jgi:glucosamine-6-phosphate deaminase